MVKWKKMNKKIAGLLLGVMMLFTASTTAFAYVDESAEASKVETTQTEQSTDKEEKKDEATNTNEVLPEDGTDKGTAFTTPGKCFNFLPNVIIVLFSCASKSPSSSFFTEIQDKVCNHNRCDHQLTDACVFMNDLRRCAHVADNGMDLSTVTGVDWWKFTYQSFCSHAASWKDISGKSIRDDETKSKRNSRNFAWL